jgi:hypothetical protein
VYLPAAVDLKRVEADESIVLKKRALNKRRRFKRKRGKRPEEKGENENFLLLKALFGISI